MTQTRYKPDPLQTGAAWVGETVRASQPIQLRSAATIDLEPVNVSPVFEPVRDGTRDSLSAQDRAWGYTIRLIPLGLVALGVAILGVLAFVWATAYLGYHTSTLERTLAFLTCLVAVFATAAVMLNRTDYQHSRAGVERHRITTAADLRKHEIDALLTLRREALRTSLKLIEGEREEPNP